MSAFNAIGSAIYGKLAGGTALTGLLYSGTASIYNADAPFDAKYDYVIFNVQSGVEPNDSAHRVKEIALQVRAYATNLAKAGTIDAACDALLHKGSISVTGWTVIGYPLRSQDIELVEYDEAHRPIYTRGGLYEIKIERS